MYSKNRYENEIEDEDGKIFSRFNDTVSHEIDFTAFGLPRDHALARMLKKCL